MNKLLGWIWVVAVLIVAVLFMVVAAIHTPGNSLLVYSDDE